MQKDSLELHVFCVWVYVRECAADEVLVREKDRLLYGRRSTYLDKTYIHVRPSQRLVHRHVSGCIFAA